MTTQRAITFHSHTYIHSPFPGAPEGAVAVTALTGQSLISLHNLLAANLGTSRVKRFSDNAAGVRRTWAALERFADTPLDELAHSEGAGLKAVHDSEGDKPNQFKVEGLADAKKAAKLSPADQAQIKDEAAARKPAPQSEALIEAAAAAGAKAQAQAALRTSPPASDNPAKDAEMPALRKAVKVTELAAKKKVYPRKAGSKQAVLVDLLSRPQGATFGELYDGLAATGKPWKGVTIRSGLAWDINHIAGYGVTSELLNGEEFAKQGRVYEANRLGVLSVPPADVRLSPGYDPDLKLAVYRLTYPAGMEAPLPHTPKKA